MAGTRIEIAVDGLEAAASRLTELAEKGQHLGPLFNDIGEMLLYSHKQRNAQGIAPDGTPWAELSETTQGLKPRHQTTPLRLNDILLTQLLYQADDDSIDFGSNMVYAAMQQFGGKTSPKSMIPNKLIPARPFIGLSDEDEQAILEMVAEYFEG